MKLQMISRHIRYVYVGRVGLLSRRMVLCECVGMHDFAWCAVGQGKESHGGVVAWLGQRVCWEWIQGNKDPQYPWLTCTQET